jgi:hypothetical protein
MRQAEYHGETVEAGPKAPGRASCPACGWPVVLKATSGGGWAYYHVATSLLPVEECPLRGHRSPRLMRLGEPRSRWPQGAPEYTITLAVVKQTLLDALDGEGVQALQWLYCDLAQAGLRQLLRADEAATLAATERTVARLTELVEAGEGRRVRQLLAYGDLRRLQECF